MKLGFTRKSEARAAWSSPLFLLLFASSRSYRPVITISGRLTPSAYHAPSLPPESRQGSCWPIMAYRELCIFVTVLLPILSDLLKFQRVYFHREIWRHGAFMFDHSYSECTAPIIFSPSLQNLKTKTKKGKLSQDSSGWCSEKSSMLVG